MIFIYILICLAVFLSFMIYMSWKRKKVEHIFREMKLSGEAFILGPEVASFRGATAKYGRIKCDGVIGLTNEKIIFVPFVSKKFFIPTNEIKDVSESKKFLGHYRAGISVLVLHSKEADIGFFVKNVLRWQNAIRGIIKMGKE